jgi:hypothetical protein
MTSMGQGTVRRMTQFPVPLLRTNVKPARSNRVRSGLSPLTMYSLIGSSDPAGTA